jgi:endoglucanase
MFRADLSTLKKGSGLKTLLSRMRTGSARLRSLPLAFGLLMALLPGIMLTEAPIVTAGSDLTIVAPATAHAVTGARFGILARSPRAAWATYTIQGGPSGTLVRDAAGLWLGVLEVAAVPAGTRNVVVSTSISGSTVSDTAWRVKFPGRTGLASGDIQPWAVISHPSAGAVVRGTMLVQATADNATALAYAIDGGRLTPMTFNTGSNAWQETLDSRMLRDGPHGLHVFAIATSGGVAMDSVSQLQVGNSTGSAATSGPPSITITRPLSNHSYSGTIPVQAQATNAASVAYSVDGAAPVPMSQTPDTGIWHGLLDTTTLASGFHNIDVLNTGIGGATASDRAWNISVMNAFPPAVVAPPSITATSTVPATPGPWRSRAWGVNYSGAEFGAQGAVGTLNRDYMYPADRARGAYFSAKDLRLVRLPITWERLQRQAFGPLSATDLAGVRAVLDASAAAGQQVVIDLHNFGRYYGSPLAVADAPKLANFWQQLAAALRGHPALYGYELMNEPHDLPEGGVGWAAIAQSATNGVRLADTNAWVLVPGYGWQSAAYWPSNNPSLAVQDSSNRLHYAAHLYFDRDYSGVYARSYDTDGAYASIGVDRVQPFLSWLAAHNVTGMLTEYGVPGSDPRWLAVLDNFLSAVSTHPNISGGTYWSAGLWWGSYPLSVEPTNGVDKPQMVVLTKYRTNGPTVVP